MTDRYAHYKALKFSRPRPRVLEVMMSNPGKLNALDADDTDQLLLMLRRFSAEATRDEARALADELMREDRIAA